MRWSPTCHKNYFFACLVPLNCSKRVLHKQAAQGALGVDRCQWDLFYISKQHVVRWVSTDASEIFFSRMPRATEWVVAFAFQLTYENKSAWLLNTRHMHGVRAYLWFLIRIGCLLDPDRVSYHRFYSALKQSVAQFQLMSCLIAFDCLEGVRRISMFKTILLAECIR